MENNFLSLIKTRRSVRAYKSDPVPSEALDAVLEAGTYAPTGGGRQSPTIIAITDPKYRQEIAKLNAEVMGSNADPYYGAPVVILVLADGSASTFVEDGSWVRLRYVTLSYNLPTRMFGKAPISNLQVFGTGRNLLLFTNYSGVDPEVSGSGAGVGGSGSFGFDNLGIPATRGFDIGLRLTI